MKYTCSMETVQQNGRFTLFSSKFLSIYSILYVYNRSSSLIAIIFKAWNLQSTNKQIRLEIQIHEYFKKRWCITKNTKCFNFKIYLCFFVCMQFDCLCSINVKILLNRRGPKFCLNPKKIRLLIFDFFCVIYHW